jgi:hypothetical protein
VLFDQISCEADSNEIMNEAVVGLSRSGFIYYLFIIGDFNTVEIEFEK